MYYIITNFRYNRYNSTTNITLYLKPRWFQPICFIIVEFDRAADIIDPVLNFVLNQKRVTKRDMFVHT